MSKVLIVGGGHAGANTAFALRKDGFDGDITIISDEDYLPYHRPPLSKDFLKQNVAIEKLSFKSSDFYKEQNISLNLNTRIDFIDLESNHANAKDTSFDFDYFNLENTTPERIPARFSGKNSKDVLESKNFNKERGEVGRN